MVNEPAATASEKMPETQTTMKDILYLKKSKGEPVSAFLNQTPTTDIKFNGLNWTGKTCSTAEKECARNL